MKNGQFTTDGPYKYPTLWDGCLLAYAPCVSGPTGLTAYDFSGRSQTGSIVSTTADLAWSVDSTGLCAFKSNGGADCITVANQAAAANGLKGFAISQWLYMPSSSGYALTGFNDLSSRTSIIAYGGALYWFVGGSYLTSSPLSGWHHYVLNFAAPTFTGYFDGSPVVTGNSGLSSIACVDPFNIGNGQTSNTVGTLTDDVRVYSRALNTDEITLLSIRRGVAFTPVLDFSF